MQTRLNSHQSLKQAGTPTLLNLKKCRFQSTDQINAFTGIDLRHYESGNFLAKEHITKRGNPYARKIGSIISVVGKTTVEIIELFECKQKVP